MNRTQIYLTDEQQRGLKDAAKRRGVSMAELIRRAVDTLLRRELESVPDDVFDRTLGVLPDLEVPGRAEWDRGYG